MANFKGAKRSLLMSALAIVLCVSMLVGSTFAWFTDTESANVNAIQSGTLEVDLMMFDGTDWVSAEGQTLNFLVADADGNTTMGTNILWEPGCTYELPQLKVVNNGNLALKYQIHITGIEGDAKLLEVIDFTVEGSEALTGTLAREAETAPITLVGTMSKDAGNEYQGLTLDAISVTVVATQLAAEFDSMGNDYDEDAWHPAMKVYNANDLQSAINNGETNIVLEDNIDLTESITIPAAASSYSLRAVPNAVVINLNGKTISNPNGYVFESQGNLVLEGNGTVSGLGGIRAKAGSVTINGGNYYASSKYQDGNYQHTLKAENAIVTINGGNFDATVNGQSNAVLNASTGAVITINGGNFKNVAGALSNFDPYLFTYEKNGAVVINDGTFYGGWRFNGETATTDIYGGNFSLTTDGQSFNASSTHVLTVYGGTFTFGKDATKTAILACVADTYEAVDNGDGSYTFLFPQASFDALIDGAQAGDTVEIPAGTYTFPASKLEEGMTLECAPGTVFDGKTSLNINGATVVGATFTNDNAYLVNSVTINGTFKDCVFTNTDGLRYCYAGETVVFENCVFDTDFYGVHFDGGANDVVFKSCTFSGFNTFGSAVTKLTLEGCTFDYNGKGGYNGINLWGNSELTDCTFIFDGSASYEWVDLCGDNQTVTFEGCVVTDGVNETPIANVVGDYGTGNTIIVNGKNIAISVGSLESALKNGEDVALESDITTEATNTAPYGNKVAFTHNGGTLDGKGNTISVTSGGDCYAVMTAGGTIKNLTVDAGFRGIMIMDPKEDIYLDNVTSGGDVCYALNTGEGDGTHDLIVTNSTFKGWTSIGTAVKSVSFTNCTFGQGDYYTNVYGRLVKPYVDCVFDSCEFGSLFYIDLSALSTDGDGNVVNPDAKVVLKNCTVNGVLLTAENWTSLIVPESECVEGQICVELKDGTYLTAENLADYITIE